MGRLEESDKKRSPTESKGRKDFELFQKTFKKYQQQFGLTGYKAYFNYESLDGCFANISIDQDNMTVTARLNSELPDKDKPHQNVEESAKHEAIHLLLGRLECLSKSRYIRPDDIYEAVEELTRKLEGLIK